MEENVETVKPATTMSVGLKYGLIAGLVGIVLFFVSVVLGQNPFKGVWNWLAIGMSIVLMFLAQKNYKDNGDGFMSYGQGIGIAFWITLLSTILSCIVMWAYLNFVDDSPMNLFYDEQRMEMETAGAPEEAIEMTSEWTRRLFWVIAFFASMFYGMIIALILTIFTQKKPPEQTF